MKFLLPCLLLLLSPTMFALKVGELEYSDDDVRDMYRGLDQWREVARSAASLPPEEAIPKLGFGLAIYISPERQSI